MHERERTDQKGTLVENVFHTYLWPKIKNGSHFLYLHFLHAYLAKMALNPPQQILRT